MTDTRIRSAPAAAFGVALFLGGLLLIWFVAVSIYKATPTNDVAALRLGLAGACLASGLGQIAVLVGGWLIWRALPRSEPDRRARREPDPVID